MKTYLISFFYYADPRCTWEVQAHDEVRALAAAMEHHNIKGWCENGSPFSIEISLK